MTIRNLDNIFSPKSVVLIGASDRPGSVGTKMTENFLKSGFKGSVWLVNPKHRNVQNHTCYRNIESLPETPDLAIIAIPPKYIPKTIAELGKKGTKAGIVLTAGMHDEKIRQAMLDAAQPYCFRIVGPNCLGTMMPKIGLNAGFAHAMPLDGDLAFISQSGAIISAVLDWSLTRGIGFSSMISMGDMVDVDVGDLLDYLAADSKTRAILMYLEQVTHPQKFMSAARSAARAKPVIVVKSGRHAQAAKAAKSHTGALAGEDSVYSAAFQRAGLVRVNELEDLFDAAEVLSIAEPLRGERLAIVTNGGGAGILAVDALEENKGTLAALSENTMQLLDDALPPTWSRGNPVDIIGDAGTERYETAVGTVLADPNADAVLVLNCPTALASGTEAAAVTIKAAKASQKPILTCWLGDKAAAEARCLFAEAAIPTFDTPADAIRGFTYLTEYRKAQVALMQAPASLPEGFRTDETAAHKVVQKALENGRDLLSENEAKAVLAAYGIPVVETLTAKTPEEAGKAAEALLKQGTREVVVKILSQDIAHKSDIGCVVTGIKSPADAQSAAREMQERIGKGNPALRIDGFTVQPMIRRSHGRELIIGVAEDKTFGPVVLFGTGGTAVEVIGDRAVALPPLDLKLAHDLMSQTQAFKRLKGYRNMPPVDLDAVALTLVRVSQMIADYPEITELDINPLLADENGVIALDARIVVKKAAGKQGAVNPRFAIRPYPKQWERKVTLKNGKTVFLRPIRPEDEKLYKLFTEKTSPEDMYHRFFSCQRRLSRECIALLTQLDYARAMAFAALDGETGELIGVSRLAADPDYASAEYALLVRSDRQGEGIGWTLMDILIDYAKAEGIGELWGEVMYDNAEMLKMCRELGFTTKRSRNDAAITVTTLSLASQKGQVGTA